MTRLERTHKNSCRLLVMTLEGAPFIASLETNEIPTNKTTAPGMNPSPFPVRQA